jgi:hypothetical protein
MLEQGKGMSIFTNTILVFMIFLISLFVRAEAQRLDCEKIYPPAKGSNFPFTWRGNRCEGLIKENTSYNPISVKITYFGFGRVEGVGPFEISNTSNNKIELNGELLSRNTFYRLVARLSPDETISWKYPDELKELYGDNPERISFLARLADSQEELVSPFSVMNAKNIQIGIVSRDSRFNLATVFFSDRNNRQICSLTHEFKPAVKRNRQVVFGLDECSSVLSQTARISVKSALRLNSDKTVKYSDTAFIWLK